MKNIICYLFLLISLTQLLGCKDHSIPKPRGYFRITLPEKSYHKTFAETFNFSIPDYTTFYRKKAKEKDDFYEVSFPKNGAKIYLSYFDVNNNLPILIEEAHKWAFKHSIRADAIEQKEYVNNTNKTYGLVYTIEGNAASPMQFYLTDSTKHFLRGALYFHNVPNQDSLQPVINFITKDIVELIETTHWNE
ncbi:gliding motility lipoprotein GldD [Halosquirtibacter laminarini]|uniref:Gliding motility lipoprotein GldD n=1 Tax=Halosquirtibacter laminarini TaxID=3374600 RepID=A0AC61NPA1_9BACT|nr:gliding motility lipoprotein GldD [Prolixibacteraceae bacterium]